MKVSVDSIKKAYAQIIRGRGTKQLNALEERARVYREDLLRKDAEYKQQVEVEAARQKQEIDARTKWYLDRLDEEIVRYKQIVEETVTRQIETNSLSADDVAMILNMLLQQQQKKD